MEVPPLLYGYLIFAAPAPRALLAPLGCDDLATVQFAWVVRVVDRNVMWFMYQVTITNAFDLCKIDHCILSWSPECDKLTILVYGSGSLGHRLLCSIPPKSKGDMRPKVISIELRVQVTQLRDLVEITGRKSDLGVYLVGNGSLATRVRQRILRMLTQSSQSSSWTEDRTQDQCFGGRRSRFDDTLEGNGVPVNQNII